MTPSISVREWIRWPPQAPSEPTSTLVLTSPERRFVDIRLLKADQDDLAYEGIQPLSQLDWAFAGTSSSSVAAAPDDNKQGSGDDEPQIHAVWTHFVDSSTTDPASVVDAGDIFPQPDGGSTLECGRMRNPCTGEVEAYEERWWDVEPAPASEREDAAVACVVIVLHDDEKMQRGMVVRIGKWCQGIVRVGESVSLERWEWDVKGGWKRKIRMGDMWLPCGVAMECTRIRSGGEVKQGEQLWEVVELVEGE